VDRIFEVFLQRNVPTRNETFVTFVRGRPFERSFGEPIYRLDLDPLLVDRWGTVSRTERGEVSTPAGTVEYLAVPVKAGGMILWHCLTLHQSPPNRSDRGRRAVVFEYKDPQARLLTGSFAPGEVHTVGRMVRGSDPRGELLSAF